MFTLVTKIEKMSTQTIYPVISLSLVNSVLIALNKTTSSNTNPVNIMRFLLILSGTSLNIS